jgi:hypothetical protein
MKRSMQATNTYDRTLPFVVIAEPETFLPFLEQGKIASLPPCIPSGKDGALPFDRIGYWG